MSEESAHQGAPPAGNDLLSLAGVMQAASLVDQLAFSGAVKERACFKASLHSLLQPNHENVADVYSSTANLQVGLQDLERYLSRNTQGERFANKLKYLAQLNRLGALLSSDQSMAQSVGQALTAAAKHKSSSAALIKYLAQVYYDNFSALPANRRIIVLGKKEHLRVEKNIHTIRALLFAGVRASLLWRIHGGGVLALFFQRRKLLKELRALNA